MSGIIRRIDLITDEAFNWPEQYKKKLEGLVTSTRKLGAGGQTKKAMDQLTLVQNNLAKATERSTGEYIQQKAALDKLNKSNREAVKDVNSLDSAYDKLSRELEKNRKAYKDLAAQGKANTTQAKRLRAETQRLDKSIKQIDRSVGQSQRSVGKYSDALKGMAARVVGITAVVFAMVRAMKSAFDILVKYTSANSKLNAILNATKEQTRALRDQQLQLGKATAFSATQVAEAQTELARLGLTMDQITALTPAILDAAVALGVDMAQAAELVAGQLNAFSLEAREGKRVADVLVRATQISAFNYERLATSLSVVSPAAKAAGASIEETVAIMSAAVDANIDASTAATGLRNIFIELSNAGLTWDEAMTKIQTSTDKLKTANELFGKRSAVVSLVIAENTEKINENTAALETSAGAAEKFADETLDNLKGDIVLLTSAWEGFILSLENGDGVMSRMLRGTFQAFGAALRTLAAWADDSTQAYVLWQESIVDADLSAEQLGQQSNHLADEIKRLQDVMATTGSRADYSQAEEDLARVEQQRGFILTLLMQKIKAKTKIEKDDSDATNEAAENAEKLKKELKKIDEALKKAAQARKTAISDWLKLNDALEKTHSGLSKFGILTKEQEVLLQWTEAIFGASTLDADANKWVKTVGDAIKKTAAMSKAARDKETQEQQKAIELRNELIFNSLAGAQEIFANFADLRQQQLQQEMEFNEFQRDRELARVGDNERAQFEINKQFDEKRKELQRKQANTEKANAIFQIAVNTAVSIAKTAATLGFPAAIPFVALAGILGAAQAAAVLAAPVPQFDEGTESTPKDYVAGEKRPEFRLHANKWSLVDKPTKFSNSAGDTIVSGAETDSILGQLSDLTGSNLLSNKQTLLNLLNDNVPQVMQRKQSDLKYVLQRNNEELIKTIKNKKEVSVRVSSRGTNVREKSGNMYVDRIDYYYNR